MIDALPLLLSDEGYQISRSVRLRSSASAYFNRTPGSASNRTTWTWSGWVKGGLLGDYQLFGARAAGTDTDMTYIGFNSNRLSIYGSATNWRITTQVFRDPSAWYHIVVTADTSNATANNRLRIYVNGVEVTVFSTINNPALSANLGINSTGQHQIGVALNVAGSSYILYLDGYLTEVNFIDGQALTPSSFGETNAVTGVWQPKKYTGTYGTNGFYLNFSDNSAATAAAIGKDSSGNGNNWTPNNISVTAGVTYDSMLDVPTQWADGGNGRGNYAVLNPLQKGSSLTVTNGNLDFSASGTASNVFATMPFTGGKFYFEVTFSTVTAASWGIATKDASITANIGAGGFANFWGFYCNPTANYVRSATNPWNNGTITTSSVGQIAVDATDPANVKMWIGVDNTWYNSSGGTTGDPTTGSNATETLTNNVDFFPFFGAGNASPAWSTNFGQRPFAFSPPTGFKALNTLNLPTPTILKGNQYFDATTYTGTGATQTVGNGGGFAPDFVWTKSRSGAYDHFLLDSVRGGSALLISNSTSAEFTGTTYISSFAGSGFTIANTSSTGINASGSTYVGWQWKEGATQGFDIVTYTGTGVARTVAHSLGVAPRMMIVKDRSSVTDWRVYHALLNGGVNPANYTLKLNGTNAQATDSTIWNNTAPTSSVFSLGANVEINANGNNYVAYLFAAVAGYSAFGSYTGNGSADGTFVYLGFRPEFVMIKRTDVANDWVILDTARNTFNVANSALFPNSSSSETSNGFYDSDIVSNGFKIRATNAVVNASGGTYIYAAFCESPFKNSLAR